MTFVVIGGLTWLTFPNEMLKSLGKHFRPKKMKWGDDLLEKSACGDPCDVP